MDERTFELSELYTRILQLEHLQDLRGQHDSTAAIQDHIEVLRKRFLELKSASIPRTNG
ncbi:MAG TPA: hypothetical protein VN577_17725 [Terriglobales bacterium]|nr:hypothetical protein [Terriglobales bacterium]